MCGLGHGRFFLFHAVVVLMDGRVLIMMLNSILRLDAGKGKLAVVAIHPLQNSWSSQ